MVLTSDKVYVVCPLVVTTEDIKHIFTDEKSAAANAAKRNAEQRATSEDNPWFKPVRLWAMSLEVAMANLYARGKIDGGEIERRHFVDSVV